MTQFLVLLAMTLGSVSAFAQSEVGLDADKASASKAYVHLICTGQGNTLQGGADRVLIKGNVLTVENSITGAVVDIDLNKHDCELLPFARN